MFRNFPRKASIALTERDGTLSYDQQMLSVKDYDLMDGYGIKFILSDEIASGQTLQAGLLRRR